jgi:hypothetical protein
MIKRLQTSFLWFLVLFGFLFNNCKKQENPYDLFPLKLGNEFYFKYKKSEIGADTKGTETWKVVSESSQGGSIKYQIERKLNAIVTLGSYKIVITDSITYLEVNEDKSSSKISLWEFLFKRYQSVSQIELKKEGNTSMPSLTCVFKADSGLTSYNYYHPPNQLTYITFHLDSLKIIP